jgi:hypothetical protein
MDVLVVFHRHGATRQIRVILRGGRDTWRDVSANEPDPGGDARG